MHIIHSYHKAPEFGKSMTNFMIGLLEGTAVTPEILKKRMDVLHAVRHPFWYVLSIVSNGQSGSSVNNKELISRLSLDLNCAVFTYNDRIICILGTSRYITDWAEEVPQLDALIAGDGLVCGISRRFDDLSELRKYYQQSISALDYGTEMPVPGTYLIYDNLNVYQMFQLLGEHLSDFCNQRIRGIADYDALHKSDLCSTLRIYLENNRSLTRTAEALFVHKNTVHYRIDKCISLIESDLTNENEVFNFILSLRIVEFERTFRK
jgi:sugar diacid utilization regulator